MEEKECLLEVMGDIPYQNWTQTSRCWNRSGAVYTSNMNAFSGVQGFACGLREVIDRYQQHRRWPGNCHFPPFSPFVGWTAFYVAEVFLRKARFRSFAFTTRRRRLGHSSSGWSVHRCWSLSAVHVYFGKEGIRDVECFSTHVT